MYKISYTVSVYNEEKEIEKLLESLNEVKTDNDEIVVVQTYRDFFEIQSNSFIEIQNICKNFADIYETMHFLDKFADLKNYLISLATKDYIFNFDADEFLTIDTLDKWKSVIVNNTSDLYYVPRINTVDNHTIEDIKKYNWSINEYGWINWPDYQPRIFKNNTDIVWSGDVHETIKGYSKVSALPAHPSLAIIHQKTIEKQRSQNNLYETIKNN